MAQLRGGVGQDSLPFFIIRRNALPPTPFLHQTDGIASYAAQRGAGRGGSFEEGAGEGLLDEGSRGGSERAARIRFASCMSISMREGGHWGNGMEPNNKGQVARACELKFSPGNFYVIKIKLRHV